MINKVCATGIGNNILKTNILCPLLTIHIQSQYGSQCKCFTFGNTNKAMSIIAGELGKS